MVGVVLGDVPLATSSAVTKLVFGFGFFWLQRHPGVSPREGWILQILSRVCTCPVSILRSFPSHGKKGWAGLLAPLVPKPT